MSWSVWCIRSWKRRKENICGQLFFLWFYVHSYFPWWKKQAQLCIYITLCWIIQGVPLATEPGISLIILTPMKILQQNIRKSSTLCKSIGRWGTLNWIFPAGWNDIPHFTCQHGQNSALFRRPRHFEGTLATMLARSDAAWLFLISEWESHQNKPWAIDALKTNITEEIQAVTADVLARTFQNTARRVQSCLDENGGHFQHMLWCRHISYTTR